MKLFQIHAEFLLPDDFDGDFPAALLEIVRYWNSKEAAERERHDAAYLSNKSLTVIDWEQMAISHLLESNKSDGARITMAHAIDLNYIPYPEKSVKSVDFKSGLNAE